MCRWLVGSQFGLFPFRYRYLLWGQQTENSPILHGIYWQRQTETRETEEVLNVCGRESAIRDSDLMDINADCLPFMLLFAHVNVSFVFPSPDHYGKLNKRVRSVWGSSTEQICIKLQIFIIRTTASSGKMWKLVESVIMKFFIQIFSRLWLCISMRWYLIGHTIRAWIKSTSDVFSSRRNLFSVNEKFMEILRLRHDVNRRAARKNWLKLKFKMQEARSWPKTADLITKDARGTFEKCGESASRSWENRCKVSRRVVTRQLRPKFKRRELLDVPWHN